MSKHRRQRMKRIRKARNKPRLLPPGTYAGTLLSVDYADIEHKVIAFQYLIDGLPGVRTHKERLKP